MVRSITRIREKGGPEELLSKGLSFVRFTLEPVAGVVVEDCIVPVRLRCEASRVLLYGVLLVRLGSMVRVAKVELCVCRV